MLVKKATKKEHWGAFISIAIILIALSYFIYLSYLFFNGKIDPKFQSQTFVSNENIDIELSNELIGFDYLSQQDNKYLNQFQDEQNQTYFSFVGVYMFSNSTHTIRQNLDIIRCKNPQLKNMNCFDFSKLPQQVLTLGNMNQILSSINLYIYKCSDTDQIKSQAPNNCAEDKKIEELINISSFYLNIKLRTSQFNTSQQEIQDQFKSQFMISKSNIVQMTNFKIQNQRTSVKQGFLIQSEQYFQSPISYLIQSINYYRQQFIQDTQSKYLNYIYFEVDENITYFHIQYPTFTEVLALCNSTIALMLFVCSFCRQLAQKIIRQDIFFIVLQNMFSKTYMKLLQDNNQNKQIIQQKSKKNIQALQIPSDRSDQQQEELEDDLNKKEQMQAESKNDIQIPQFKPKFGQQFVNKVKSQKLDQTHKNENKEEAIKQTNIITQLNSDIDFKKQDNNLIDVKLFNLQILSSQEQIPTILKFDSDQKNSPLHSPSPNFKEKLIQLTTLTLQDKKVNNRITSTKRSSFRQKESIIEPVTSKQMIDNALQMVHQKQFTQKLGQKIFDSKQFFKMQLFKINYKIKNKSTRNKRLFLYKNRLFQKRIDQKTQGLFKETRKKIEQQIDDSLDFFKFFKEMLFLKKAVLVLLSKEQLAAIYLVGLDIDEIDPKNHKIMKDEQGIIVFRLIIQHSLFQKIGEESYLNYIKEQFEILKSTELQSQYIKLFLQRCSNKLNQNSIDKRILSSFIVNEEI